MQRRKFITLIGGAAAWPIAARAQQTERVRRIGGLIGASEHDSEWQAYVAAFREELSKLGWSEGRNVWIDIRFGEGDADRMQVQAAELVRLAPDVIFAGTAAATRAVQQRTQTIPIVFAGSGPLLNSGTVRNIPRPEGNTTGFANTYPSMNGKLMELLKEVAPHLARIAFIFNPDTNIERTNGGVNPATDTAAQTLAIQVINTPFHNTTELERAIESFAAEANGGLSISSSVVVAAHRELILRSAAQHRLPMISAYRSYPAAGGLMAYGVDFAVLFRGAASYVDRILRGAKATDLPVQFPQKFELTINLKTAKTLGLIVPPALLVAADEVIE